MTTININGVKTYSKDILNIRSVSFDYLGHKVYSAEKIQRMLSEEHTSELQSRG